MKKLLFLLLSCIVVQGSVNAMFPVHEAARNGDYNQVLTYLRTPGANINLQNDDGRTFLHQAIRGHRGDIVNLLLQYRIDCTLQDFDGDTPLHRAARENDYATVVHLLRFTNGLYIKNYQGEIPWDCAYGNAAKELWASMSANQYARMLAFVEAQHPRLGAQSPAHFLVQDHQLLRSIFAYLIHS